MPKGLLVECIIMLDLTDDGRKKKSWGVRG